MTFRTKYRLLEMIPGSAVWLTFILAIVLSFIKPIWAIYFIILFDLYWLLRITYFVIYLFIGWAKYKKIKKVNWREKVKEIPGHQNLYHIVVLATYKEPEEVIKNTTKKIYQSATDPKKMIIVWSRECGQRAGEYHEQQFKKWAEELHQEYDDKLYKLCMYVHPVPPPNELQGKGSNATWAIKKAKREVIDPAQIPYAKIIVSNFDSDTEPSPQYFSYLTYQYLTQPDPTHASYQPLTLYNNTFWQAPSFARVVSYSTTFWLMTELARPERMLTFSSHSMSFKSLVEVGFWETDLVTEDSRIFLQCFLHYHGRYRVVPMYVTISMDTVLGDSFWETIKYQYKQMRRWAWSVEHFPYEVINFTKHKEIPWRKKIKFLLMQSEGQYSWATAPILMLVVGRLPLWVAGQAQHSSALVQNASFILETLMGIAMIGILATAAFSLLFIPKKPSSKKGFWHWIIIVVQWILIPVTMIIFGSIPATEAQTRLMLGKYLGFDVTKKARK